MNRINAYKMMVISKLPDVFILKIKKIKQWEGLLNLMHYLGNGNRRSL